MSRQKPTTTATRLGKSGGIYILVAALALVGSIYTQNNLLYWSFGLMVGGFVVSSIWVRLTLRNLSVRRVMPDHAIAGETTPLHYEITSAGVVPVFGVVIAEVWGESRRRSAWIGGGEAPPDILRGQPACWIMHLGPGQSLHVPSPVQPQSRGVLQFERIVVQSSFPFGVFTRSVEFEQPAELMIYPPLYRMDRQLVAQMASVDFRSTGAGHDTGGQEDFYGLREYREGDSLRTVDWKRSASRMTMVSREQELPMPPKMQITLDLPADRVGITFTDPPATPDDETATSGVVRHLPATAGERAISMAASLICEAFLRGCEVGLTVRGVSNFTSAPRHNLQHRATLLDALCRIDFNPSEEDRKQMRGRGTELAMKGAIPIVVTAGEGSAGNRAGQWILPAAKMADFVVLDGPDTHTLLNARTTRGTKESGGMTPVREMEAVR